MLQDKIPENIFIINNDMWWSKDDIGAYDYLVRTNSEFNNHIRSCTGWWALWLDDQGVGKGI